MPQPDGQPFGKYELFDRIAAGGMAEIYRARYRAVAGITKQVVIKKILPHYAGNHSFIKMFMDEAKIVVGLSHGNIAQVFDFGEIDGEYFLAMELVHGQALSKVIRRARDKQVPVLPTPFAVFLAMEMCKGLHYAHTRLDDQNRPLNIVHRDVSPQNVIVAYDGQVKLVDFGIAKARTAGRNETEAGAIKGKYVYFSPEQARGRDIDARTDVFATGIVLYEMLCGRLPFEGKMMEVLQKIVRCEFPKPRTINPDITPALERILLTAMAADKNERYPTAQAFQEALAGYLYANAPTFSGASLQHLMAYLYEPELVAEGTPVKLPRDFLEQVPLWQKQLPPGPDAPRRSSRDHEKETTAGRASRSSKSKPKLQPSSGVRAGREEETRAAPATGGVNTAEGYGPGARPLLDGKGKWILAGSVPVIAAALAAALVFFIGNFGTFSIQLSSSPPGATVSVDGQPGQPTPVLVSGLSANQEHVVQVSAPGRKTVIKKVQPARGTTIPMFVELELDKPAPQVDLAAKPPDEPGANGATAPTGDSNGDSNGETKLASATGPVVDSDAPKTRVAEVAYDLTYPQNEIEVEARHHVMLIPPSRASRVRLDPKKTYTVWTEGIVSLGGILDVMQINNVFYFLEGNDQLAADEAFGQLGGGKKHSKTIRNATALYAFVFDDRPYDNSGGTKIRIQAKGEKDFSTVIVEPKANALWPDTRDALTLHGLSVDVTYDVSIHSAASAPVIRGGKKGRASRVVFLENPGQLMLHGQSLDTYARVVTIGSTFQVTGTEYMKFFFLDDAVEDNEGGVRVEVTPTIGTGSNLGSALHLRR